ncbi:MAG: cyclic nucleotide-binding/CBS domain-containing protein [bacterium]
MKTAEDIINEKSSDMIWVSPDTTIEEALKIMVENRFGSMVIKDGEKIVGIWTERDLMEDILTKGFDPKKAKIGDYMTKDLITAPHTDTVYHLLDKFLGLRQRHLFIEKEGKYIGLLSTGDVIRAGLLEKDRELSELNAMVSWNFYEDWKWKKKK